MHVVAVVAQDGVIPFDLATPCEVFGRVRREDGSPAYSVRVCGVTPRIDAGAVELTTRYGLRELARADSVIVPGVADPTREVPAPLLRALRRAATAGTRIASICSGAFSLAAAGLLDGLRATTHWLAAAELARRYPAVRVDPNVLYVDNGQILTSAGAAAGLDLCLHLVRRDLGAAIAADAARISVMPLERAGGQAQFITHTRPTPEGDPLEALRGWIDGNLERNLDLHTLARRAAMSTRTLSRKFRDQLGTTPTQWVLRSRVLRAQHLLETTPHPIERIATEVGFGSATTLRERFRTQVGTSPQAYRRAFRAN